MFQRVLCCLCCLWSKFYCKWELVLHWLTWLNKGRFSSFSPSQYLRWRVFYTKHSSVQIENSEDVSQQFHFFAHSALGWKDWREGGRAPKEACADPDSSENWLVADCSFEMLLSQTLLPLELGSYAASVTMAMSTIQQETVCFRKTKGNLQVPFLNAQLWESQLIFL